MFTAMTTKYLSCLASAAITWLALTATPSVCADIYRWTDENGNTVYSDQKRSEHAESTTPNHQSVNYYDKPKAKPQPQKASAATTDGELATLEVVGDQESGQQSDSQPLTEAQCQALFQLSCDEVINWKKYALEACGSDERCADPNYLDRKYRPRTIEELAAIARRAAVRNNNVDDKIDEYLRKKFSNQCENQAALYCQKRGSRCMAQMTAQCDDPRSLGQVLAQYDQLTPLEKQAIIEKARQMATASGENSLDVDQMVASLAQILISQALLGL